MKALKLAFMWCLNSAPMAAGLRGFALRPSAVARTRPSKCTSSLEGGSTAKVVFLGTPSVAAHSLETLAQAAKESGGAWEICCVVSQPAQLMGRGSKRKVTPSPVEAAASGLGIPVFSPEKAKDDAFLSALEALEPDLCITAAYGQWLPKRFLAIPRFGTLNIHPSLLPRWRGASPVQRCLEAGDAETGVSVLWTVSKMDAGNIAGQSRVVLGGDEKAPELLDAMFELGTQMLVGLLPSVWSGQCSPESSAAQGEEGVVTADKIMAEESQVCFAYDTAQTVHNKIRGFAGWPGVWSTFAVGENGPAERIKLVTTRVASAGELPIGFHGTQSKWLNFLAGPCSTPGSAALGDNGSWSTPLAFVWLVVLALAEVAVVGKGRVLVPCAGGSVLELLEVQAPGKRVTDAKSFANGLRAPLQWVEEGGAK